MAYRVRLIGVFISAFIFVTAIQNAGAAAQTVIGKAETDVVLLQFKTSQPSDFRAFVGRVAGQTGHDGLKRALDRYRTGAPMDGADRRNVYRLLGAYTRIKHRDEMVATLERLVSIPTDKKEGQPQFENPNIHKLGREIEAIARKFGLAFRNYDNRIFEVTLKGAGAGSIGVFTHGDVVPVNPAKWVLEDGTKLDPFKLTVIGDRMYGRGASDNKGSITVALYVLGTILQEKLPITRTIRFAVETTEETGGAATEYYKSKTQLAPYNLVLDGRYPVGVAEKGFGIVMAKFPVRKGAGGGPEILEATGGVVLNQIPAEAKATVAASDPAALKRLLDPLAQRYVADKGGNFTMDSQVAGDRLVLTVKGEGSHSARPSRGVNPTSRLYDFLHQVRETAGFTPNHFTDAAAYVSDNWGLDYLGGKLGIGYSDPFMGALTTPVTYVKVKEGALHLAVNPRAPRGKDRDVLVAEIRRPLEAWKKRTGIKVDLDINIKRFMYRDPKGPWIQALLSTFREVTGIDAKPRSSNGYTSARQLPNGVQFGPGIPGRRGRAHKPNEFKSLEHMLTDAQIVTEAILRLGNLERME